MVVKLDTTGDEDARVDSALKAAGIGRLYRKKKFGYPIPDDVKTWMYGNGWVDLAHGTGVVLQSIESHRARIVSVFVARECVLYDLTVRLTDPSALLKLMRSDDFEEWADVQVFVLSDFTEPGDSPFTKREHKEVANFLRRHFEDGGSLVLACNPNSPLRAWWPDSFAKMADAFERLSFR